VLDEVSVNINNKFGTDAPAGLAFGVTVIAIESVVVVDPKVTVNVPAVELSDFPVVAVPFVADTVIELAKIVACEGIAVRNPRPKAAAATSAVRLIVVLVDIYFLSIVVTETFSMAALR